MKKTLLLAFVLQMAHLSFAQVKVSIDTDLGEHTISKHIYGHFSEHLGRCIYDGFYVGENSNIPNINGMRTDIIDAFKRLKIPNLRWPGGCFADTYHWKDGIGPKENRPSIVNTHWGGVTEDNSFGSHEFMELCRQLGTEPYISGNVGSGTVQEMSDWVQYMNFKGDSPMSKLRAENGHEEPFKVKYWGIGNETWGCGGNMTAEYYANIYRQYATYVNSTWDPKERLFKIASGASDGDYHWTEVLMRDIPLRMLDGVGVHHYSVFDWRDKGPDVDFTDSQYFATMNTAMEMEEIVRGHETIMDKYDPQKRVAMMVDEWGGWYNVSPGTNPGFLYQQNTMRDAMLAAATLNIFNNHADRIRWANLAQAVNVLQAVILTEGAKMILTPTFHVMEMYVPHHEAKLLPTNFKSPDFTMEGTGKFGGKLPAITISSSKGADGKLFVSICNIALKDSHKLEIDLRGGEFAKVSGKILASAKVNDYNGFDTPNKVVPKAFNGAKIMKNKVSLTIPPTSVITLTIE